MTCWYFAGKLGLPIAPRPPGRGKAVLEFRVRHPLVDFNVEVKAPKGEPFPEDATVWSGNEAAILERSLAEANRQFPEGQTNVLVIAPQLRVPITNDRYQLLQAFLGEFAIAFSIDRQTGGPSGDSQNVFIPRGQFVRSKGKLPDGTPDPARKYTRVSAVVAIEECFRDPDDQRCVSSEQLAEAAARGDEKFAGEVLADAFLRPMRSRRMMWVRHNVFVMHNPFAKRPLDLAIFGDEPQFTADTGWSDGHRGI